MSDTTTQPGIASRTQTGKAPARRRDEFRLLRLATTVIVTLMVLTPILALVYGSFRTAAPGAAGEWTLRNYMALMSPGVVRTMGVTLAVGLLTSALCIVIGTVITLIVHRTDFRHGKAVTMMVGLAFYFPSFILAMAWIIIGAPGGIWNVVLGTWLGLDWLRIDVYSLAGIVFVMVLHQVPFVYLTMRGPIMGMDGIYEEAARVAGASPRRVLFKVTLPLLSFSLLSSFILTFIITIEQFAIPALLGIPAQVNMLATQLYLLVRFSPTDYGLAAAIGIALSAITGAAIWAQRRVTHSGRLTTVTGKTSRLNPIRLGRWHWLASLFCFGFIALGLVLPMLMLIYTSLIKWFNANPMQAAYTFQHYAAIFSSGSTMRSFSNTLIVSGVGAAFGVMLGLLTSYFTVRSTARRSRYLDFIATLPFGVPGIVLGLGLLWAYAYLPLPLYGTLTLIIVSFVTRYLPYATETIGGQMVQVDKSLEEAAWVSGATRAQGVRRILLPLVAPSIQGAYFLMFMAFFREISSAILLYTGATAVISISIWAFFEQANWGLASALSVIATLIIFVAMALITALYPAARRK